MQFFSTHLEVCFYERVIPNWLQLLLFIKGIKKNHDFKKIAVLVKIYIC